MPKTYTYESLHSTFSDGKHVVQEKSLVERVNKKTITNMHEKIIDGKVVDKKSKKKTIKKSKKKT